MGLAQFADSGMEDGVEQAPGACGNTRLCASMVCRHLCSFGNYSI